MQDVATALESNGFVTTMSPENVTRFCSDASCQAPRTTLRVEISDSRGFGPSIAIGADGKPIISYGASDTGSLKVAVLSRASWVPGVPRP